MFLLARTDDAVLDGLSSHPSRRPRFRALGGVGLLTMVLMLNGCSTIGSAIGTVVGTATNLAGTAVLTCVSFCR